jgi:glycine/D-amino acid oxidase-like deaminating enzyme
MNTAASVVIIGGGICGLGTALLLARDGHTVTVLERDADELPPSPQDAWDRWVRKGVAQFRQPIRPAQPAATISCRSVAPSDR